MHISFDYNRSFKYNTLSPFGTTDNSLGFQPQSVEHLQLDKLFSTLKLMTAYLFILFSETMFQKQNEQLLYQKTDDRLLMIFPQTGKHTQWLTLLNDKHPNQ